MSRPAEPPVVSHALRGTGEIETFSKSRPPEASSIRSSTRTRMWWSSAAATQASRQRSTLARRSIAIESSVKEIHPDRLAVQAPEGVSNLKNHFLFVFAGAEMPHKFLMGLGVQIDKKFGEKLKKSA